MAIDFQGLFKVLKASEERPANKFDMGLWLCGTAACMIGSFCDANKSDELYLDEDDDFSPQLRGRDYEPEFANNVATRFGITNLEAGFLFTCHFGRCKDAAYLTQTEAIRRLRKFIYYKLHKQEMIVEEGRNKRLVHHGRDIAGRASVCRAAEMARCG